MCILSVCENSWPQSNGRLYFCLFHCLCLCLCHCACVQHDRSIFNIWIVLRLSICGHGAAYWVQFYFCLLITSQRQINSSCLHLTYIQFVGNEKKKKIQPHIFHWLQNMQTYDKCASKWTKNRSDIFQVKSIFNEKKTQQQIFFSDKKMQNGMNLIQLNLFVWPWEVHVWIKGRTMYFLCSLKIDGFFFSVVVRFFFFFVSNFNSNHKLFCYHFVAILRKKVKMLVHLAAFFCSAQNME